MDDDGRAEETDGALSRDGGRETEEREEEVRL